MAETGRAGVLGLGTMGAGIAEVLARGGWSVTGVDADEASLERGRGRVAASVGRAVERGRLDAAEADAVTARIAWSTAVEDLAGCTLVVEAVPEVPALKREVFTRLDAVLGPDAVLATNTSSLSVTALAAATTDPGRVVGVHFFNPAPVQRLVEVVTTVLTRPDAVARVQQVLAGLGKTTITCRDRPGFVVNALLVPYLNAAAGWFEAGWAERDELDAAMVAAGMPMGPLALLDLVGHDVTVAVLRRLYAAGGDRRHLPGPLLVSLVEAGWLGRKTGRGYHPYGDAPDTPLRPRARGSRVAELPDALVVPYLNDCLALVGSGYTSPADVDTGMSLGCAMPKPFDQLAALGPASALAVQRRVFAETAEPGHRPAPLLEQLAAADDPDLTLHTLRAAASTAAGGDA